MTEQNSGTENIEIIPEEGGYFLKFIFDDEQDSTLIFIADQDFESLQEMADNPEKDWEDFRNEFFLLVEHTGHDQEHELSKATTRRLQEKILQHETE